MNVIDNIAVGFFLVEYVVRVLFFGWKHYFHTFESLCKAEKRYYEIKRIAKDKRGLIELQYIAKFRTSTRFRQGREQKKSLYCISQKNIKICTFCHFVKVRFSCAPRKLKFFVGPMNLVDLFAILPFVLDLIIGGLQVSFTCASRPVVRGYSNPLQTETAD